MSELCIHSHKVTQVVQFKLPLCKVNSRKLLVQEVFDALRSRYPKSGTVVMWCSLIIVLLSA